MFVVIFCPVRYHVGCPHMPALKPWRSEVIVVSYDQLECAQRIEMLRFF